MSKENFMEELRNKLISDKCKEWIDDTTVKATLYKLLNEKDNLQQENQQLKECIKTDSDKIHYWVDKSEQYKSVLDEIREYCNKYGALTNEEQDILQILDKVKE